MALITLLGMSAIIAILASVIVARFQVQFGNSVRKERALQAEYAARAGIQGALDELTRNPAFGTPETTLAKSLNNVSGLGYDVRVCNNWLGDSPMPPSGDRPEIPPHRVWIKAQGSIGGEMLAELGGQAEAFVAKPDPIFDHAWHQSGAPINFGPTSTALASMAISGTASDTSVRGDKGVDLRSATLNGKAIVPNIEVPFLGDPADRVLDDTVQIPMRFRRPVEFPTAPSPTAVHYPGGNVPAGSYTSLVTPDGSGGNISLKPGIYYFQTSFEMGYNTTLTIDDPGNTGDPVVIYVGSMLIFDQGVKVNPDGPARQLQFYTTDEMYGYTQIYFGNGAEVNAVISGQQARVDFAGQVKLKGAFRCASSQFVGPPTYPMSQVDILYDSTLTGAELDGKPEWVVVEEKSGR